MSRLLGLREWLNFNDSLRYMRQLDMEGGQADFFPAYSESGFPMQLACKNRYDFFTLALENPEDDFPFRMAAERIENGRFLSERGKLFPVERNLVVASSKWQGDYDEKAVVWVSDPLSFGDESPVEPVYYHDHHEGTDRFYLLCWSDLMREWAKGILQFSRPHIEDLVDRAMGRESAAPSITDSPPSYTTRLLQIQGEAIQKFWANYDLSEPDTAPDKSAIIDWLTDTKGCSQQEAQAIDLIIRHDSRKKGGAKPKG